LANEANSAGQGARVLIAPGIYRESVDLNGQKTDAALIIEGVGPTTVLTGADVWNAGWTAQSDGSIEHTWPYKWGMKAIPNGWDTYWNWDGNGYKRDILRRSEMVYVNGTPLMGVLSLAELAAAGRFYVDETNARLHVRLPSGVSLAQAVIEVGTRLTPLRINARRNVTLRNFAVMRNRGAVQDAAVLITNCRNVAVELLHVNWTAYAGMGTATTIGLRISNSVFSDNGVYGIGGYRDQNVVLEDSEIARNNWRGWPVEHKGWDSVHKWGQYRDAVARRLRVVDNAGNGFWLDHDNQRITLQDSLISGNQLQGVDLEKNQGPITLSGNRICNNVSAGIADAQSDALLLQGNQIFGNAGHQILFTGDYAGQRVTDYLTGLTTITETYQWIVTDNIIAGSGTAGRLWTHTDFRAPGSWARVRNAMVLVDRNRWYHTGLINAFWLPQGQIDYTEFRRDLQLANPQHEMNSVWQAPPSLSCTMPEVQASRITVPAARAGQIHSSGTDAPKP
jgi:hypothetical protein